MKKKGLLIRAVSFILGAVCALQISVSAVMADDYWPAEPGVKGKNQIFQRKL